MPIVNYYFQGEVGESLSTPNAFVLRSPANNTSITFGQFLDQFPSSANSQGGRLHFRFQEDDSKLGFVWVDVISPHEILPVRNGQITAKVLCLDSAITTKRIARLRRKQNIDYGAEGLIAKANIIQSRDRSDGQNNYRQRPPEYNSSSKPNNSQGEMFSERAEQKYSSNTNDLVDFGMSDDLQHQHYQNSSSSQQHMSTPDIDFGSMAPMDASPGAAPAVKLNRDELVAIREAAIQDKVQQALEFKQELDDNLKREGEELDAAKAKHEKNLTEWAFDQSKKKRNVRTLLTTMGKVLWADSAWKPIGLGDVIEPKKVKLQFRKAMLVVHPDRCAGLTSENRFIGKRIFEAVNEAYQEFLKTESVE